MRSEVLSLQDMINQFNIDKISKSGAQFDFDRLEFFNQMHLRERFSYTAGNREEMRTALSKWRALLQQEMSEGLQTTIRKTPDDKMVKIMDLMAVRMRYMKDIRNHTYFFETPDYQTDLGRNFLAKLKQSELTNKKTLADLASAIEKVGAKDFDAAALNKICSVYLFEQNTKHG